MGVLFRPPRMGRGVALLLLHCAALCDADRVPARVRLDALVGRELARLLVAALTGQGRRGSSSP